MSSPSGSTGASQRASEINNAMLNVPGYADDSMLFMMRYGALAKETLRKVDWDEFQLRLSAMNAHWYKSHRGKSTAIGAGSDDSIVDVGSRGTVEGDGANTAAVAATSDAKDTPIATTAAATCDDAVDPAAGPGPEPEPETDSEAAELKARTLELIQDFPRLVRDFDRFVECTRIMATRYKR